MGSINKYGYFRDWIEDLSVEIAELHQIIDEDDTTDSAVRDLLTRVVADAEEERDALLQALNQTLNNGETV